jgi:hypothetical protein
MSKLKPNIITPFNDKQRFKDLVLEVINDTSIYAFIPDSISLSDGLFILTLTNKKFVYEEIKVDGEPDYVDVYLQGIKKTANTYSVSTSGNDIVITFNQNITLRPIDIITTDFLVKGKIVNRQ